EVIDASLKRMNEEKEGLPGVSRPWIQDLGYGNFPPYTADQVRAEFQAAADNGAKGWMIWNARATFTESALGPPVEGEDAGPTTSTGPQATPPSANSPSASPSASPWDRGVSSSTASRAHRSAPTTSSSARSAAERSS